MLSIGRKDKRSMGLWEFTHNSTGEQLALGCEDSRPAVFLVKINLSKNVFSKVVF